MSGGLETIPARHGTATFVPKGHTIKIINTYGKQVVSTWAFALHQPPQHDAGPESLQEEFAGSSSKKTARRPDKAPTGNVVAKASQPNAVDATSEDADVDADPPGRNAGHSPEESSRSIPAADGNSGTAQKETEAASADSSVQDLQNSRGWTSYLPSIRRSKVQQKQGGDEKSGRPTDDSNAKKWSSYIPSGKGFTSYLPSKDSLGTIASFHQRDPNASYAEQLYQFSKTPVGAAGLSVASGSGTASSLYAAYNAYAALRPSPSAPPMEYLSLPHTRAATQHIAPQVNDVFLTNLRMPILTLIEDTTPGNHDTLTAACDAHLYFSLGVEKSEEHNSCAVNLVMALNELNDKAGLKGEKRVGADITVNIAPTPLHLFMNAPWTEQGEIKVAEPKGDRRSFVKLRAERDVVVVMSACPMPVGPQNGGKCMAANFVVEDEGVEQRDSEAQRIIENAKRDPTRSKRPAKLSERRASQQTAAPRVENKNDAPGIDKKKPRKLERRSGSTPQVPKSG